MHEVKAATTSSVSMLNMGRAVRQLHVFLSMNRVLEPRSSSSWWLGD